MNAQRTVSELLSRAGIGINGSQSWDVRVRNEQTFPRILARGSLGLGETYMEGWWECAALDEFFYRILTAGLHSRLPAFFTHALPYLRAKLLNSGLTGTSFQTGSCLQLLSLRAAPRVCL